MIIFRSLSRPVLSTSVMKLTLQLSEFQYSKTLSKTSRIKTEQTVTQLKKIVKTKKSPSSEERIAVLKRIIQWRAKNQAPVDIMGCERLADPNASMEVQKFQTLVALMLSVQTRDETTYMIVNRLKEKGLTPEKVASYSEQTLRELIHESNFNKRKAANLIAVSRIVLAQGLARSREELMTYPGVGLKIAMLYMKVAQGKEDEGIGVDTHVHRISNRLEWVHSQNPQETQVQLRQAFPSKYWKDINVALVGFGQIRCQAKKPLCEGCPVMNDCPSAKLSW